MFRKLLYTPDDGTLSLMRVVLGVVFFAHGAQKALGWFGGPGYGASIHMFHQMLHLPPALAVLAILAEFLGGIFLVIGFLARIAALGIVVNMMVAVLLVHLPHGLFMNWTGKQGGEGFEYHLLAIAIGLAIVVRGAGAWSLDRALTRPMLGAPGTWRIPRAA